MDREYGIKAAADNIKDNPKIYPLAKANNKQKMKFINVSGLEGMNTILPMIAAGKPLLQYLRQFNKIDPYPFFVHAKGGSSTRRRKPVDMTFIPMYIKMYIKKRREHKWKKYR